mmetsp:Transcript_40876/g.46918  ORF Transcript_40876/g.46918 Transcript_40876/m.46918 type:complete len:159 (+) Transcript_40876:46-522(+)
MNSDPQPQLLKGDVQSDLQKIFGVKDLHSHEGKFYSKDLMKPHPDRDEDSDQDLKAKNKMNQNSTPANLCGSKRKSSTACTESHDSTFKLITATSRLFSPTEDGLHANGCLNQSSAHSKLGEVPLGSLAGVFSSMKARGRATSSVSDSTIFSCTSKPR